MRSKSGICAALLAPAALAAGALGQSDTRAVFVAHYFPVNSVSPIGATVAAFRINADDTATLVGNYVSGEWTQSLALSPDGRWLASANGTANTISEELRVYRVNPDASLTQVHQRTTPDSPLDMAWVSDTVLAVTETDQGNSRVQTYRWDAAALTLSPADSEPSGYFTSAVAVHPLSPWLYTQDSGVFGGSSRVTQWGVAPDGTLDFLADTLAIDPVLKPSISPDGRWMFSGTGAFGGNTVAVFRLDPATGAPSEVSGSPFVSTGDTPYRTAVSSDNRFVFVGHTRDDTVRTFTLDGQTGALAPTGSLFDVGSRPAIGPMAVVDDLVVVFRDSGDPIGLFVLRIGQNGELTQLGPIYDTGNRRPELAAATWVPPAPPACPADVNADGAATVQDVFDFLGLYFAADPRADFNGVGGVTVQDVFDFLGAYFAGCP